VSQSQAVAVEAARPEASQLRTDRTLKESVGLEGPDWAIVLEALQWLHQSFDGARARVELEEWPFAEMQQVLCALTLARRAVVSLSNAVANAADKTVLVRRRRKQAVGNETRVVVDHWAVGLIPLVLLNYAVSFLGDDDRVAKLKCIGAEIKGQLR